MLSIGELARRTGVKVPTIRYYEGVGLLAAAGRSAGNQRRYGHEAVERLSFIRHGRDLGLSLKDIGELIALGQNPEMPCAQAHVIAEAHLAAVQQRLARLRRLETELTRILMTCEGEHVGDCYVIHALADRAAGRPEVTRCGGGPDR